MKKRMMRGILFVVAVTLLSGCGLQERPKKVPGDTSNKEETTSYAIDNKRYKEYSEVLEDILEDEEWPDGTRVPSDWNGGYGYNKFAICDINKDGNEELIVEISNVPVADMVTRVFDYDAKKDEVFEVYCGFPGMEFYDNGLVYQPASHGQSGNMIYPYELFQYNKETKEYDWLASAYSVERNVPYSDYDPTNDEDQDGVIYYVSEELNDYPGTAYTKAEYEEWIAGKKEKAEKQYIPWEPLWGTSLENLEYLAGIEGAVKPIPINIGEKITQYDVNGNGKRDRIQLVCDQVDMDFGSDEWGLKWRLLVNGEAIFTFAEEYAFNVEVWLYRVSDERVYLLVKENCITNNDIHDVNLYQFSDGKIVERFECYGNIASNINEFHMGIDIGYIAEDKLQIIGWNQFNATAGLRWHMEYDYDAKNHQWKEANPEYKVVYDEWQEDKEDGMVANQSFKVYKSYDSQEEAFTASRGMTMFIESIRFHEGKTYFKVRTTRGQKGWFVDPEESYIERNGEWIEGYFEEAMFAG